MSSESLRFALTLTGLHAGTLLVTWALFAILFRKQLLRERQAGSGKAPEAGLLRRATIEVVLGQLVFGVLCAFVIYPLWIARGGTLDAALPAWHVAVAELIAFIVINDTIFYWSHRALHARRLFDRIHVRHHRFKHVRVPVAEYAHPIENLLNLTAFFAGPLLLGSAFPLVALWVVIRIFETAEAHSGYALTASSSRHAFHHLHAQRGCYGSFFGLWDRLMGTDAAWRAERRTRIAP